MMPGPATWGSLYGYPPVDHTEARNARALLEPDLFVEREIAIERGATNL
jgi:hypothetical protein